MLPARNRMRRSEEFDLTVKSGVRAAQPDLVIHARHHGGQPADAKIGLVVTKSVGGAVDRHRVARRIRHAVRTLMAELDPADRIVIRALPGSRRAASFELEKQLRAGMRRVHDLMERTR